MYFLLGICLLLVLFLALNISASLAVAALWRVIRKFVQSRPAHKRARIIFALRIFPVAGALVFIFAFLLPSYFLFEPVASGETVGLKLIFVASLSAIGIVAAFYRVFKTWLNTVRLIQDWDRHSQPVKVGNSKVPVYRIEHPFPVISLVGIFRPRIFISSQIFDLLSDQEMTAAMAHEYGHLKNHDNLKRWLLRVGQDLLIFPIGKKLDRIWAETAETVADEYAAAVSGNKAALDLAAALIKIARIVPPGGSPAMPAGAFLIEEHRVDITFRVRNLLQITDGNNKFKAQNLNYILWFGALSMAILGLAINYNFLLSVHNILEEIVEFFQ
jgi:Zn-dependent protease with chaperone function